MVSVPIIVYSCMIIVLFIGGIITLSFGIRRYRMPRNFKKAEGIIQTKKGFRLDHGKPRVIYEVDGTSYMYDSRIGQQSGLQNGKKVVILYNPNNPEDVHIDNFVQRGGRNIIFGIVMIFASVFFLPIFILAELFYKGLMP